MTTYLIVGAIILVLLVLGANPTPTARQEPVGYKMPEGFKAYITFAADPSIKLWEKAVKPPALDGKEAIDTTTQHNITWRTHIPRQLKDMDKCTFTFAYDPDVWANIVAQINKGDTITVRYPEGSTLCFYGSVEKFEFGDLKEGEFPEGTCTIQPSNWDFANSVEAGPVFTGSGT